jgi:hypothetical protein
LHRCGWDGMDGLTLPLTQILYLLDSTHWYNVQASSVSSPFAKKKKQYQFFDSSTPLHLSFILYHVLTFTRQHFPLHLVHTTRDLHYPLPLHTTNMVDDAIVVTFLNSSTLFIMYGQPHSTDKLYSSRFSPSTHK